MIVENMGELKAVVHTCVTCGVQFASFDMQRDHYKSEWHRYNVMRKASGLKSVAHVDFEQKLLAQQKLLASEDDKRKNCFCSTCNKSFQSEETFNSHVKSKKHEARRTRLESMPSEEVREEQVFSAEQGNNKQEQDVPAEPTPRDLSNSCLFCRFQNEGTEKLLNHMLHSHGFFVPSVQYCTDVEGLMDHLRDKVFSEFCCLWCRISSFPSVDAVQNHMRDKGHCKLFHDGESFAEFLEYYDVEEVSSEEEGESVDDESEGSWYTTDDEGEEEEKKEESSHPVYDEDACEELVLPSGAKIGHRCFRRYYKQNIKPESMQIVSRSRNTPAGKRQVYSYVGLAQTGRPAYRVAMHNSAFQKFLAKKNLKLGVRANKLQHHFRQQIGYF